jgi:hypothetical protein
MMPSHGVQRIPEGLFTELPRRGILGSPYTGSCIAPVLWGQKRPIAPLEVPKPKPYILWCCIKMRVRACVCLHTNSSYYSMQPGVHSRLETRIPYLLDRGIPLSEPSSCLSLPAPF